MTKTCTICGKKAVLASRASYDMNGLGRYAFASRKIPEYMHYELWECKDCGYLMSENAPDQVELAQKYGDAEFDSGQEASDASATYLHYLKKYCPDFPKGRAMDIGTGEGSWLKRLLREGVRDVTGVEPSRAPVLAADKKIRRHIVNDIFRASDYEPETFDMISCFQTIEHIPDPGQLLAGIHGLLKKGGIVYIVCHDYRSPVNRMLGMKSPVYDIEHLQLFSERSIRRLVKQQGFEPVRVFALKNRYPLKYWLRLFPFPAAVRQPLLKKAENSRWGQIRIGISVGNTGVIACRKN